MIAEISRCGGKRKCKRRRMKKCFKRWCHKHRKRPFKLRTYYYYAKGDGRKRIFTLKDGMPGYDNRLPASDRISITNVFVDGMLQFPELYLTRTGRLQFISDQPPPADSIVIAQFIAITL